MQQILCIFIVQNEIMLFRLLVTPHYQRQTTSQLTTSISILLPSIVTILLNTFLISVFVVVSTLIDFLVVTLESVENIPWAAFWFLPPCIYSIGHASQPLHLTMVGLHNFEALMSSVFQVQTRLPSFDWLLLIKRPGFVHIWHLLQQNPVFPLFLCISLPVVAFLVSCCS